MTSELQLLRLRAIMMVYLDIHASIISDVKY